MKKNIAGYQIPGEWKKIFLFSFLIFFIAYLSVQTAGYKVNNTGNTVTATIDRRASSSLISKEIWDDLGSPLFGNDISTPESFDLIAAGASWKYLDKGTNPGTSWRAFSFSDDAWKTGNAELGYGDGGEATVVSYGPSSANKYITTYFRKKFNVASLAGITGLELKLIRDDGAVVYLNGQEVYRSNMPSGIIYYNVLAPAPVYGPAESTYVTANISSSKLLAGNNVIAVEIHQNSLSSSDISFNLKLKALTTGSETYYTPDLFAIIGDYGQSGPNESAVANLVKSWHPEYIITLGDNNYPRGASSTIDVNIGKYYHSYIKSYNGFYGSGAPDINRFFPSLGNHDIITSAGAPYFQYFTLPGNERYYDFIKGKVHFFVINSNPSEPNGAGSTSAQATWLKNKLASSVSKWKIVYFHHSPYVSDAVHGNQEWMQWPFKQWGADAVFSSHSHVYERIIKDNLVYIVNGLGGHSKFSFKSTPVPGSQKRYNANFGAILVMVKPDMLQIKFYNIYYHLIDSYQIIKSASPPPVCDTKINSAGPTAFCPGESVILSANTGPGFSYQWIKNGANIPGATASSYKASTAGDYQVKVSVAGCTDWSALLKVTLNSCQVADTAAQKSDSFETAFSDSNQTSVNIYPNPTTGLFTFDFCPQEPPREIFDVSVFNFIGQLVYHQPLSVKSDCVKEIIDLNAELPAGIYVLQIRVGDRIENAKFLLNR